MTKSLLPHNVYKLTSRGLVNVKVTQFININFHAMCIETVTKQIENNNFIIHLIVLILCLGKRKNGNILGR